MWSKLSSALKQREGNDSDTDHSDAQSPDPFRIDATTYYTQQAPPTPPSGVHSRSASREEDIIWSLRTQLALQQEMCAQFEIDLAARDKLVEALTIRLEASEQDNDKRKNVVRSWKKKAAELEKICRHLEEEVDSSRQESMERSTMDEASREALRQLHCRISQLEREKSGVVEERDALAQAVKHSEAEIAKFKGLQDTSDEVSRLRTHIQQLQKDSAVMEVTIVQLNKQRDQDKEDINGLNIALESKQQELELVKRKHGTRGTVGLTVGRTNVPPSTTGSTAQPSKRNSLVSTRPSSPVHARAPSTLGRVANTRPPTASAFRRASGSNVEGKIKSSRRASIGSMPSETADEKENISRPVPLKHTRRPLVPA